MKVEYTNNKNVKMLGYVDGGSVVRPINSLELYLVADYEGMSDVIHCDMDSDYIENPQNVKCNGTFDLEMVISLNDGSVYFMPSATKVEVIDCKLLVEGD